MSNGICKVIRNLMNRFLMPLLFVALATNLHGQVVWTNASAATGWLDPLNWNSNLAPTNGTEYLQFSSTPTGAVGVGINLTAAGGVVSAGAIEVTSSRSSANLVFGNTGSASGILQLNGAMVNGIPNTILRNAGLGTTTLVISNGFGVSPAFPLVLSNTLPNAIVDATSQIVSYMVIAGNGFTKTGGGFLTLTASNQYSGNTTLNAGVLQLTDGAYLNNSTLVLAGGTFERAAQSITPRRNNAYLSPVNVTANSIIRTTTTSTRTVHFESPFTGNAGTTLMLTNTGTVGTNHFRLYAGGYNYAGNLTLGANGTTDKAFLELFCTNNPAGGSDVVFTGLIKGGGVVYKNIDVNPGGNVIFSNANSYTGGTELRAGFFGLGANNCLGTGNILVGTDANPIGLYAVDAARILTNDILVDVNSSSASTALGCTNIQIKGSQNLTLAGRILIHTNFTQFTISNTATTTFAGVITNAAGTSLGIVKQGPGKLVLSASNTFSGSVIIAAGTLALSGNGSFNNATNLVIPGGMTFDVSALNTTWTTPNSQTLRVTSQNGVAANINCSAIGGLKMGNASPLFLEYANGNPALNISGGNFTLGGGSATITVLGSPLPHGLYLLADTSAGGSVSGNATNAVVISGAGLAPGLTSKLEITGGKLYLNVQQFFIAYDAGLGLFGGENVIFTNTSGTPIYAWSSADPTIPVTTWNLEGRMNELPLGTSGFSRYGINLNPGVSPTYYIFGTTNTGPYNPTEPLAWLTTDDFVIFNVTTTNAPITTNGIFQFPTPPVITQQPVTTSVLAGQNANFSVTASGSTLSYQWFFNNSIIPSESASALVLTNVNASQAATYFVVVTNYLGSATSSVAALSVSLPPAIAIFSSTSGLQITGNSLTGLTYVVESTADLTMLAWIPVWTNNTGVSGNLIFQTNSYSDTNRFFRLRFP